MIIRKAQSIFEYVILISVIAALTFASLYFQQFSDIKKAFNEAFTEAYARIIK